MKQLYFFTLLLFFFGCIGHGFAQSGKLVKGQVISSTSNEALEGISVSLDGITLESAIRTDKEGKFELEVPNDEVTLLFEYPDYQTKSVYLGSRTNVYVKMVPDYFDNPSQPINALDGLNQRDRLAISPDFVLGENLKKSVSTSSFDAQTVGKLSGVYGTTRNGLPSSETDLLIHGVSSFSGSGAPLVIVDGVMQRVNDYPDQIIDGGQLNSLADLNPQDIESITVLKDAAAAAIYGARAGNGVILVTTHKGEVGKTKLELSTSGGVSSMAGNAIPMLNAEEHRLYAFDQLYTAGWTADDIATTYPNFLFNSSESAEYQRYNNDTDWSEEVFNDAAVLQDYYMRVSGGDKKADYSLSIGARMQDAILETSDLNRYNARLNVNYRLSEKLTYGNYLALSHLNSNQSQQGNSTFNPVLLALAKTPTMAAFGQNAHGANTTEYDGVGELNQTNPIAMLNLQDMSIKRDQFNALAYLDYTPNKNLYFKADFNINLENQKESYFIPGQGVVENNGSSRMSGRSTGNYMLLDGNLLGSYTKQSGAHLFNANVKASVQRSKMDLALGEDLNANTDYQKTLNGSIIDAVSYGETNVSYLSALAHANYVYADKYLVNATVRSDASSRFGENKGTGVFPSVSLGWKLSNEEFLQNVHGLDLLRVNTSYGIVGNSDQLPQNQSRVFFVPGNYINFGGVVRNTLANPDLKWETNKEFTLGFEFKAFGNRFNVSANYYNKNTSDIVVPQSTSSVTGFDYTNINGAEVLNQGLELDMNVWLVNHSDFKWNIGANLTQNKNEIISLPNGQDIIYDYHGVQTVLREGESIGSFYGFETAPNVYSTNDNITLVNEGYAAFQAGDVEFIDQNNDGIINDDDKTIIGNGYADLFGGVYTTISYKNLELSGLFDYRVGNDVWNATRSVTESMASLDNQSVSVLQRWEKDGDVTSTPRANLGDPVKNSRGADRWIEDGSFLRLRNIKLQYTFPTIFNGLKVYVSGDNLITFSDYLGMHPEVNTTGTTVMPGVDYGNVPQTKSVLFGVNISL